MTEAMRKVQTHPAEAALAVAHYRLGFVLEALGFSPLAFDSETDQVFGEQVNARIAEKEQGQREAFDALTMAPLAVSLTGPEGIARHYSIRPLSINGFKALSGRIRAIASKFNAALSAALGIENEVGRSDGISSASEALSDDAYELMFELAPPLAADREWIETNVHPAQVMDAAAKVIDLNTPFFQARGALAARARQGLR